MALSMFLRNPEKLCISDKKEKHFGMKTCTGRMFAAGAQTMRLATAAALPQRIATNLLIPSSVLKETANTPIFNAARSLRTSSPNLSAEKGHDHAKLWVIERAVSAALIPLIPIGLFMPNKVVDSILAILITAHSFWGTQALVVEYLRVLIVGPIIPKLAMMVVYTLTAFMLGGLFYLIFNDVGMCRAFLKIWQCLPNIMGPSEEELRKKTKPPPPEC